MVFQILIVLLVAFIVLRLHFIDKKLLVLAEKDSVGSGFYSTLYPVFSEAEMIAAQESAIKVSRELALEEAQLYESEAWQSAIKAKSIASVEWKMHDICHYRVIAQENWRLHAILMDANIAVLAGQRQRDDALRDAEEQFRAMPLSPTSVADGERLFANWKRRIENQQPNDDAVPYVGISANVWEARASSLKYHWRQFKRKQEPPES